MVLPISAFFVSQVVKRSQKYFKAQQDYLGHVNGQVEETFGGLDVVQAFNHEEEDLKAFNQANDTLYHAAWKSQFLSGMMHPVMMFVGNLGYVMVAILGGYFAVSGRITVGNIQSFIQYMRSFTSAHRTDRSGVQYDSVHDSGGRTRFCLSGRRRGGSEYGCTSACPSRKRSR